MNDSFTVDEEVEKDPTMSPRAADYSEYWVEAKGLTSETRSSGSTGSPEKSSPRGKRRRSSDQLGTEPPLVGISSDTSSSLDARQHLVQVDNHIDYTESESIASPSFINHYSEELMSGNRFSGSTSIDDSH
ncbi:hypothetical protein CAEBREN_11615 [Caenorhabditis brenneri]|uniref:Uncharacterized protein n=1 Tax=Caenorhabditis brenneri TaxID=135651 RepID=G0N623_CAEBE|nr:hypothetical protein CAEBREN_11615 [Caenorhabditis brenneri]